MNTFFNRLHGTLKQIPAGVALTATLLTACVAAIVLLSLHLDKVDQPQGSQVTAFIALYVAAGAGFLLAYWRVSTNGHKVPLSMIIGVGVLLRALMIFSTPVLENDYHRYLWDGAVVAHLHNPYRFAPREVLNNSDSVPNAVKALGKAGHHTLEQVNFPDIKTIYPPVAQLVFAIAHIVSPFSVVALRGVLLLFDVATLGLLLLLLKRFRLPLAMVMLYWWNPIIIKELINTCHMDIIAFPFIAAALLYSLKQRYGLAAVLLVLAAGVKIWPLVLIIPLFVQFIRSELSLKNKLQQLLTATIGASIVLLLLVWPVISGGVNDNSGFVKYSLHWENNDALFRLFYSGMKKLIMPVCSIAYKADWLGDVTPWCMKTRQIFYLTRVVSAILWLGIVGVVSFRYKADERHPAILWMFPVALLFMLSPTQFPWYYTWMIPLLPLVPNKALLLYTLLLPLYYLQYYLHRNGQGWYFTNVVIWIQHGPVIAWLILYLLRIKKGVSHA